MPTATKKKAATKRRVAKASKPESNGSVKAKKVKGSKFAPEQPPITGMEDVDERIPELDELCERYLAADETRKSKKVERDEAGEEIRKGLDEHDLQLYVHKARKFYTEPGQPSLKVAKVKQNG